MQTSQAEGLLLEASYFGLCAATDDKKRAPPPSSKSARPNSMGVETGLAHNDLREHPWQTTISSPA